MPGNISEAPRKPYVSKHLFPLGQNPEAFLDYASIVAIREGADIEIRDYTKAEGAGKSYWGPDRSVFTLAQAKERISPEALERRIWAERSKIKDAEKEIQRLEGIRT
jgi:hypothetical protein